MKFLKRYFGDHEKSENTNLSKNRTENERLFAGVNRDLQEIWNLDGWNQ